MANEKDGKKISYSVGDGPNIDRVEVDKEGLAKDVQSQLPSGISREFEIGTPPKSGDSSRVRNAESLGSKGYEAGPSSGAKSSSPSTSRPSSLPKKDSVGEKEKGPTSDSKGLEKENAAPASNKRETAPDVGKDYGESAPPNNNQGGFGPAYESAGGGARKAKPASTDNTPEANAGMGAGAAAQSQNPNGDSLGKKNDLEEDKGKDQDKDQPKKDGLEEEKSKPEDPNKPEKKGTENPGQGQEKKNDAASERVQPQQNRGNGYGALQKDRPGVKPQDTNNTPNQDATSNARKNMAQNKKASDDRARERGRSTKKASSGTIHATASPSVAQRIRNWGRGLFGKKTNRDAGNTGGDPTRNERGSGFLDGIKGYLKGFLMRHPFVLIALILLIIMLIIILFDSEFEWNGGSGSKHCSYELNGVLSTGTVKLDNVQVELINCDGKASDYKVLETIDFEKYVVGVALAEVSWGKSPEYFKSQIVAARGFALKRNAAMCPSNPDNCFYGYNAETGKIRLRACTNDQVYCDIDKPCYHLTRSGKPTLYGPEAEGMSGATVWKGQLSEETKSAILAAAEEVKGKVLVDSSGNVVYTNFVNTDQNHWYELSQQGKNYEEILVEHYKDSGATGMNSATCTNYGNIDYGNYELSSEGDTILNERLDKFLESKGTSLEAFNKLIASNVEKNGYGTRAGVVTAAVTLIAELGNNYNVKVPYFLSGGHHDGVKTGAVGYWGSGYEDDGRKCVYSGYGNVYTVCGLDCSGFVPWAIKNGGFQVGVNLAGNFQNLDGAQKVTLNSSSAVLQAGDLLESSGHIVLVVGVDENTHQYICAEASGKNSGVLFTRRSFADSGYWGVKMDGYYDKYSLKGK